MSESLELHPVQPIDDEASFEGKSCRFPEVTADSDAHVKALTRRDFLKAGIGALGVLAALEVGGASLLFFKSHGAQDASGSVITAGPVEIFPAGSVTEFANERFFLVRSQEGGFIALHNRCPHLGCTVIWEAEKNQFLCPCHASEFDMHGDYEAPPVPRPLDIFTVSIEDGLVKVDTANLRHRLHVSRDQLVYV